MGPIALFAIWRLLNAKSVSLVKIGAKFTVNAMKDIMIMKEPPSTVTIAIIVAIPGKYLNINIYIQLL